VAVEREKQMGIIFIDELDSGRRPRIRPALRFRAEGVQRDICHIEGTPSTRATA